MEDQMIKQMERFLTDKFELAPLSLPGKETPDERFSHMKALLIIRLEEMIAVDQEGLMNLLYRIDVDEVKLKNRLAQQNEGSAAAVMAEMIIDRQLQKIRTRIQYGTGEDWSFDI